MNGVPGFLARTTAVQGEEMLQPDEVAAMVRLHELGWGAKRLSKEFGCARNTVRRYLRAGGSAPFAKPERKSAFDGLDDWLRERFFRMAAMPMSCAKSSRASMGSRSVCARSSFGFSAGVAS